MAAIKVSKTDAGVKAILQKTFPDYAGRKIVVETTDLPIDIRSYWDGGSRSYFAMVRLGDLAVVDLPQNGTPYDAGPIARDGVVVPKGYALVRHEYFCGHDLGITIYVSPDSLPKWLSA